MKIKDSASTSPYKVWRNFFCKKALHGETNFFGQIYGGMFYMWTNDQIIQGGKLMVKRLQKSSQVTFPLIDPDLGYWYLVWKINTTNRGLNFKNTFCILSLWGRGFLVKPVFFLKKILVVTCFFRSWVLSHVHIYGPDSWRSELRRYIQNRKSLGSNPGSRWPWGQMSIINSNYHRISDTAPR